MFHHKNSKIILKEIIFIGLIFFFLYKKNSLFSHWSHILDQDITIIYNSLLLSSNINQVYLDHPAYTTMFIINIFFQIFHFFNLSEIKNITDLLNAKDKNEAIQYLYNIALVINISYAYIFLYLINKILYSIIRDIISSIFLTFFLIFSPSFLFLLDVIRSEILSIIFCLLYYIFLGKFLKHKIFYLIFSGSFFLCAILAKVQIIFVILCFLLFFFIKNFDKGSFRKFFENFFNTKVLIVNIIFISLLIYYIDHFFYKRVDKIFFVIVFLLHLFILGYFKKKNFFTYPIINFVFGIIITLCIFKYFHHAGFSNSFHPTLPTLISSPISQSAQISSGYRFGEVDNIAFIKMLVEFFLKVPEGGYGKHAQTNLIFNNLSKITYLISFIYVVQIFFNKNYKNFFFVIIINFIITSLNIVFSFRPYDFYLIYSIPFNLILIAIIFKENFFKRYFIAIFFFFYITLNFSNIYLFISQKRDGNGNINIICLEENIKSKTSYMRYWQPHFDEKFLYSLCRNMFKN
jgi:hypothetical protein